MTRSRLNFLSELPLSLPCSARIERQRKARLSIVLQRALDRVNVLGENGQEGHTGCVNALSWAQGGDLLISGGDDTTVRIWKMDTSDTTQEYPFTTSCVIRTGHRANIFSAQMLPRSSRIATAAGDKEIRVFDVRGSLPVSRLDLRCHTDRVKRIVTEDSPDLFLTVSEDGTVRQHDLRASHNCGRNSCPTPLVELEQELCTLSLSPLTPYQFVVAGVGPFGFLYDRRHSSRAIEARWGGLPRTGEEITTCVRKFGLKPNDRTVGRSHITGARMSTSNGHEVLLSYNSDAVYLFSTVDEPFSHEKANPSAILPPNDISHSANPDEVDEDAVVSDEPGTTVNDDDKTLPDIPIILPRRRYAGARNVATVKDVNFLGPNDEWVTSGSDDGNFFIWNKLTGSLHGIYEGDSSVVNMVEGHPQLPVIAVSGIDTTVKLFAPSQTSNTFSRLADAESILETNQRPGRPLAVSFDNLAAFLSTSDIRLAAGAETVMIGIPDCVGQ